MTISNNKLTTTKINHSQNTWHIISNNAIILVTSVQKSLFYHRKGLQHTTTKF